MAQSRSQQRVDSEAREWFMLRHERDLTPPEQANFNRWLSQSPEHQRSYDQLDKICAGLAELAAGEEGERLRDANAFAINSMWSWPARMAHNCLDWISVAAMKPVMSMAAVAMVCVVTALVFFEWRMADQMQSFSTAIAQTKELTLEDGSQVTLGANSRLLVNFDERRRQVTLEQGQAFFSVSKDASRPFFVSTGSASVRVVGTRFDVRRQGEKVKVSVEEGIVEVRPLTVEPISSETKLVSESVRLVAGQQLRVDASRTGEVESIDVEDLGSWRSGQLVYRNARLSEVVADANRYRQGVITLGADHLNDLRVTTSFGVDQLDTMVSMLEQSLPVVVYREADNRIVILPKPSP
jgi:transmembrane sensor